MSIRPERRRRRLLDDAPDVSAAAQKPGLSADGAAGEAAAEANSYTTAAKSALDRAVSTLLPARLLAVAIAVVGCLLLVAVCLIVHVASGMLASVLPAEDVTFLRIDAPRSLGNWLASAMLLVTGAVAVFIFSLRRHRIDDYHGRYRVWIWVFLGCLVASLAETTEMARLARGICHRAAGWFSLRAEVVWPTTVGLLGVAIGVRLFFEIRRCRWTVAALAVAAACFLVAAAAQQSWPVAWNHGSQPLVARGSWLAGYVCLLTTFLLYARYVQLEVTGALRARVRRRKFRAESPQANEEKSKPSEPPRKPALRLRTDLDPVQSCDRDEAPRPHPAEDASDAGDSSAEPTMPQQSKKLSKAERRRLRREARQARMAS